MGDIQRRELYFVALLGVIVVVVVLLLVLVLAIRVKERECVKIVFEGGNLIQVTTSLSPFYLLVFSICFYFLIAV